MARSMACPPFGVKGGRAQYARPPSVHRRIRGMVADVRCGGVRVIVYGLGAIGGAVAAHLVEAGCDVAGVARGAHLEKIRADGLRLLTPGRSTTVRFPVAEDPTALRPGADDVVILA